jgi:predicted ATPase
MLTRLRVKGFKNLVDTEVRFGPFTCIAGLNGAGKSNLFDAIAFLSDLASHSIVEAASRVRKHEGGSSAAVSTLFFRNTANSWSDMELEIDFFVAKSVLDDFGREAEPSSTFLTYKVVLRYLETAGAAERIELIEETLTYVPKTDSKKRLGFPVEKVFLDSLLGGNKRSDFISTDKTQGRAVILLRQDQAKGQPSRIPASTSPRTVLSTVNTDDRPTALAARREMQSWAQLQLEPSKLRAPDGFSAEDKIATDGGHLPSALLRIGNYDKVSNLLARLLPEIDGVRVDVDEARRAKTIYLKQHDGVEHAARSLSDGTLRFLALSVIACDPLAGGVICMEEPENGIHPARIAAIVELLKDMAVDTETAVGADNPLRQIIINTHSPAVVRRLSKSDLVVATPLRLGHNSITTFAAIGGTWRCDAPAAGLQAPSVTQSTLIDYLEDEIHDSEQGVSSKMPDSIAKWGQLNLAFE